MPVVQKVDDYIARIDVQHGSMDWTIRELVWNVHTSTYQLLDRDTSVHMWAMQKGKLYWLNCEGGDWFAWVNNNNAPVVLTDHEEFEETLENLDGIVHSSLEQGMSMEEIIRFLLL